MNPTPWTLFLAAAAILAPLALSQPTGVEYQFFIDCPETFAYLGPGASRGGCPVRAIDPSQTQIMGDPALAVDPFDPANLIIASLHGAVVNPANPAFSCPEEEPGPTPRSRCILPFTTFTSTDAGASWVDNFYPSPSDIARAYGEHPAITIDPYGRVYVGSLYAVPVGQGRFDYTIVAQKFSSLQTIESEQDGEYNAEYLSPVYEGNRIGQLWFLFNPATDNMTMVWHEQVSSYSSPKSLPVVPSCIPEKGRPSQGSGSSTSTSSRPGQSSSGTTTQSSTSTSSTSTSSTSASSTSPSSGSSTSSTSSGSGSGTSSSGTSTAPAATGLLPAGGTATAAIPPARTGPPDDLAPADPQPAAMRQAPPQPEPTQAQPKSVIGIVWTTPDADSCYNYQPHDWVIGPCERSTNPVLSEGWLYVGCVSRTDEGEFPWNPDTIPGTVEMFRLRPDGGKPQYLGPSSIVGGMPKLGVRSDGRMALATATAEGGGLDFHVQFGKYDPDSGRIAWSSRNSLGSQLSRTDPALQLVDANVQDLVYREHSGVVQIVLKERLQSGLGAGYTVAPQFRKHIVAIDEAFGVLAKLPLDIGNPVNRTNPMLWQVPDEAFNDLSDDFLQHPQVPEFRYTDPAGVEHVMHNYQRQFFAVGDYGEVIFAELIEVTNLRGPAFGNPAPPIQPQPAPATSTATVNVTVPTAGLTMVGALALALAANQRKMAVATRHRLGRKKGQGPNGPRR